MSMLLKEVQSLRQEVAYLKSRPGDVKVHSQAFFFLSSFLLSETWDIK